jgi:hypothetical protein
MEEGKIATALHSWCDQRSPSMYIRMRVLPWSNTLLAWAGWDQFQPFGEPASFTSAIERWKMEEGKIATVSQFVRLKEVHQCIKRVLP